MKKICRIFMLVSGLLFFKTANASLIPDYTPLLPFAPQMPPTHALSEAAAETLPKL